MSHRLLGIWWLSRVYIAQLHQGEGYVCSTTGQGEVFISLQQVGGDIRHRPDHSPIQVLRRDRYQPLSVRYPKVHIMRHTGLVRGDMRGAPSPDVAMGRARNAEVYQREVERTPLSSYTHGDTILLRLKQIRKQHELTIPQWLVILSPIEVIDQCFCY